LDALIMVSIVCRPLSVEVLATDNGKLTFSLLFGVACRVKPKISAF
jgi:hypothetical protein